MAEQRRFRIRVIGITWIDKVVAAENAEQAEEVAQCIDGDVRDFQSNFIAEQTEVDEVDATEALTELSADDKHWIASYHHDTQVALARGGA